MRLSSLFTRISPTRALAVCTVMLLYGGLTVVAADRAFDDGRVVVSVAGPAGIGEGGDGDAQSSADGAKTETGDDGALSAGSSPGTSGRTRPGGTGTTAPGETDLEDARSDGGPTSSGRQATAGEIQVGFEVVVDQSAAYSAIGAEGLGPREERQYVEVVVEWLNENGGIAGRTLKPVIQEVNPAVGTFAGQAQQTCSAWTEDNDVQFAVGRINDRDDIVGCLAQKGIPLVAQNRFLWDTEAFTSSGGLVYLPHSLGGARWDAWVDALARTGYLDGGKYAVARFDTRPFETTSRDVVLPALARYGITEVMDVEIHQPESVAAFSSMNTELSNAVLRMNNADIDHVLIMDEGTISFFLLPQSESQGYRPAWGFHSLTIPEVISQQGQIPPQQLAKTKGGGWSPTLDVGFTEDPGPTPGFSLCDQIYRDAGITFGDRFAQSTGMRYCDSVLFLRDALERAPEISAAGMRAGVVALGNAHRSAMTFSASFGPGKYDGADVVRGFAYDLACECFKYVE